MFVLGESLEAPFGKGSCEENLTEDNEKQGRGISWD